LSASPEFKQFLIEQMAGFGPVTIRSMFGGAGVLRNDLMFGLVIDDVLYLKADATSKAAFEQEGLEPFIYEGKGKPKQLGYWLAPSRCMDDPDEMVAWSR
jgi:DNA transformation protein and related proteins